MKTCVILHNLIIDFELDRDLDQSCMEDVQFKPEDVQFKPKYFFTVSDHCSKLPKGGDYLKIVRSIDGFRKLNNDLIEHIWGVYGDKQNPHD